ncbi:MAG TPA: hypothetical protein VF411_12270 [Bacteroidia bacterium]
MKRYLPAEIIGTVTAFVAACITHYFSENLIFIAYAGSLGEGIGFYSTVFIQHIILVAKKHRKERKIISFSDLSKIIGHIILEFGPAGLIDGLLLRPFFLYLFPILIQNFTLGILIGKIVGDVTFYILVILSYEINKRNRKHKLHE